MTSGTNEALPDSIRDLFHTAFDADQLQEDAGLDPQQFREQLDRALPGVIADQQRHFARARELFLRHDGTATTRSVLARVDRELANPQGFEDDGLCSDSEFQLLLDLAVDQDDAEQYEEATAMYGFLQIVRPDQIQPYINGNIILWHQLGVNIAAQLYAQTVLLLQHPVYSYYAADCFVAAGRDEDAAAAIEHAAELASQPEWQAELDAETRDGIASLDRELNGERTLAEGEPGTDETGVIRI